MRSWRGLAEMALIHDVRVGETLKIGENVLVTVLSRTGRQARLAIAAPATVPVRVVDDADALARRNSAPGAPGPAD